MNNTDALINQLTNKAKPVKAPLPPVRLLSGLFCVLTLYAAGALVFLELREDLWTQFSRLSFTLEILLLALLTASCVRTAFYLSFPDHYQKENLHSPPALFGGLFISLLATQLFMEADVRMVFPTGEGVHAMECALCIASVAMLPSALLILLLKRGASTSPTHAGGYAVLAAAGIGCLTLRLAEANDSLQHLIVWHYIPTLIFAMIGAAIGKIFLKW